MDPLTSSTAAPDGVMFLQTITVDDQWFPRYHGTPDWIEKYIFPGGELASVGAILQSLARSTSLSLYHAENFGTHYARTLAAWRERFEADFGIPVPDDTRGALQDVHWHAGPIGGAFQGYTLGNILCTMAPSLALLFIGRVVSGITAATIASSKSMLVRLIHQ